MNSVVPHVPGHEPAYRGRFAPSPTGPMHLGSLLAAFGSWLHARHAGGRWLLRIEDLDPPRELAGASQAQLHTLQAMGLEPDEPVMRQSSRGEHYQAALATLFGQGHAFWCHCSRSDLNDDAGVHRDCVAGGERPDPAVRFRVPTASVFDFEDAIHGPVSQNVRAEVGDFVLKRCDGLWAYQLATVVDDAAQGITHVVRGADLLESTPRQILLQRVLGLPTPRYAHLPLVVDADGRKLSKSLAALPVDGEQPLPALRAVWRMLGQQPAALTGAGSVAQLLRAAERAFEPAMIPRLPQTAQETARHAVIIGGV